LEETHTIPGIYGILPRLTPPAWVAAFIDSVSATERQKKREQEIFLLS
jgi:hypothetical protein